MATALSLLKPQALDAVTNRDGAPSSPAEITNVFLASLTEATAGTGSGAGSNAATLIRAAGTQTGSSIATGGLAQDALAANAARNVLIFVNTSTAVLYVNASGTATTSNGIPVQPGGSVNWPAANYLPTGALSVIGATTGQTFVTIEA